MDRLCALDFLGLNGTRVLIDERFSYKKKRPNANDSGVAFGNDGLPDAWAPLVARMLR
jgi:hypothetical protein